MPAKEYTIGIPVATVIFVSLIVAAFWVLGQRQLSGSELQAETNMVVRELRDRAEFIPPNNENLSAPVVEARASERLTIIRVYGLVPPDLQRRTEEILREIRRDTGARPIVLHFHHVKALPDWPEDAPSRPLTVAESPEPFRTVRIAGPIDMNAADDSADTDDQGSAR